jgi:hypothetical protein
VKKPLACLFVAMLIFLAACRTADNTETDTEEEWTANITSQWDPQTNVLTLVLDPNGYTWPSDFGQDGNVTVTVTYSNGNIKSFKDWKSLSPGDNPTFGWVSPQFTDAPQKIEMDGIKVPVTWEGTSPWESQPNGLILNTDYVWQTPIENIFLPIINK